MNVEQVVPGVWRAGTRFVNWYVVDGGDGLTIIDAGLPGYRKRLDQTLAKLGRKREDVRALALTHGHIDHIGFADVLAAAGARILLHPADTLLATDPSTNQTASSSALPYLLYPGTVGFIAHALTQGVTKPPPMPKTEPLVDGQVATVPGAPLVRHLPGHTDGSCVLEFREHGVVLMGDLLCTISPITGRRANPQLQTKGSNRNSDQAMESLSRLEGVEARTLLPGHGSPWRDGVEAAIESARRIGCR